MREHGTGSTRRQAISSCPELLLRAGEPRAALGLFMLN
jgi:hypothetical protein